MTPKGNLPPEAEHLTVEQQQQAISIIGRDLDTVMGGRIALQGLGDMGVHDSAHGVFFAEAPNGSALALKRFTKSVKAEREVANMTTASERGMQTFDLAGQGLYGIDDVGTIMVTHRIPHFVTMNQLPWMSANPGVRGYTRFVRSLGAMANHLGEFHAANGAHNDAQVKNFGRNRLTNQFVAHDLEGSRFEDLGQPSAELMDSQKDDVQKLLESLVNRGYLGNAQADLFEHEMSTQILEPYLERHESEFLLDSWADLMQKVRGYRESKGGPGQTTIHSMDSDSPGV